MMTNVIAYLHTTFAYQSAVMQLITGQANFDAQALRLREKLPIVVPADTNVWRVALPAEGVTASLTTPNYVYQFNAGKLTSIQMKGLHLGAADLQPSLIDTNGAYQLARQWLSALSVDVSALDKYPYTVQSPTASAAVTSRRSNRTNEPPHHFNEAGSNRQGATNNMARHSGARVTPPLFRVTWSLGHNSQAVAGRPAPQVSVEILGSTKQCMGLRISNPELIGGPPLRVTNAAALLGPLPSPQQFVEGVLGGEAAYDAVANPEHIYAWLLGGQTDGSQDKTNRTPLMAVDVSTGRLISKALTNFDSYTWLNEKGCVPDYGVGLRFIKNTVTVDILWSAECDHLQVTYNGQSAEKDCDAARPALVRAIQTVFPNDSIIRSLSPSAVNQPK